MKICPAIVFLVVPDTATSIVMLVVSSSLVDIMYYLMFMGRATVLFSILLSSLCILFWGVSRFTGFPSNPCFLRQNPMLPWFLRALHRVVRGLGGGGGGSLWWIVGVLGFLHLFSRACSLSCQPDSWFQIPAWLSFPQGTGEPSSADHL